MKFDPQLMKDILLDVQSIPAGPPFVGAFTFEGRDQAEVNRHTQILIDERYIDAEITLKDHRGALYVFTINGLTLSGHEFLEKARNGSAWRKVIEWSKQQGQALTATAVKIFLECAFKEVFTGGE